MLIMAIDTALRHCSVAVISGDSVLSRLSEPMEKGHAERIAPMVSAGLDHARVSVGDLDRVGVVVGPGSFAGVRVGLAFARGIALGSKAALVGVTSLAALAAQSHGSPTAAVIDARRDEVYAALFDRGGAALVSPFAAAPEAAARRIRLGHPNGDIKLVGDGAALLAPFDKEFKPIRLDSAIEIETVARLAARAVVVGAPAPLYLRAPDARPASPALLAMLQDDAS